MSYMQYHSNSGAAGIRDKLAEANEKIKQEIRQQANQSRKMLNAKYPKYQADKDNNLGYAPPQRAQQDATWILQVPQSQQQHGSVNMQIQQAQQPLDSLGVQIQQEKKKLESLESDVQERRVQIESLNRQIESLQNEIKAYKTEKDKIAVTKFTGTIGWGNPTKKGISEHDKQVGGSVSTQWELDELSSKANSKPQNTDIAMEQSGQSLQKLDSLNTGQGKKSSGIEKPIEAVDDTQKVAGNLSAIVDEYNVLASNFESSRQGIKKRKEFFEQFSFLSCSNVSEVVSDPTAKMLFREEKETKNADFLCYEDTQYSRKWLMPILSKKYERGWYSMVKILFEVNSFDAECYSKVKMLSPAILSSDCNLKEKGKIMMLD